MATCFVVFIVGLNVEVNINLQAVAALCVRVSIEVI